MPTITGRPTPSPVEESTSRPTPTTSEPTPVQTQTPSPTPAPTPYPIDLPEHFDPPELLADYDGDIYTIINLPNNYKTRDPFVMLGCYDGYKTEHSQTVLIGNTRSGKLVEGISTPLSKRSCIAVEVVYKTEATYCVKILDIDYYCTATDSRLFKVFKATGGLFGFVAREQIAPYSKHMDLRGIPRGN